MNRISLVFLVAAIAPAQQDAPTFSAGTKLVQVDVVARSKDGPAAGLTKEDFRLLDNGKPQKISFFSVRSNRVSGVVSGSVSAPLPAGAVSNRTERDDEGSPHATVLLIDQKNTLQANQAFAIQRIVRFVQARRNKSDRTGIYTFGKDGKLQVVQDLTDDGELLSRAAKSLKAQDPSYRSPDVTGMPSRMATEHIELLIRERAMDTKQVLEAVASHLASVPGRKSLIWVSVGFPLSPNTLHLTIIIASRRLIGGSGLTCRGRSGKLVILRFTPRGFRRLRLDTTRSWRISSRMEL